VKIKYKSDFEVFIKESKIEDFFTAHGDMVVVSTIHKSKGKEYDNVFLLLNDFNIEKDSVKRQLYVAMTRAKNNLSIHVNHSFLNQIEVENLQKVEDHSAYPQLKEVICNLTYSDIWLGYSTNKQSLIDNIVCGQRLIIKNDGCSNLNEQSILKFSRKFLAEIATQASKGFHLKGARVNFILHWLNDDTQKEIKIILPEVLFVKSEANS